MAEEKSAWQRIKDGFKPASERADEQIQENRTAYNDQFRKDQQDLSPIERRKKFMEGLFKKDE